MFGRNFEVGKKGKTDAGRARDIEGESGSSIEPVPAVQLRKYETEEEFQADLAKMGEVIENVTDKDFDWTDGRRKKWEAFKAKHKKKLKRFGLLLSTTVLISGTASAMKSSPATPTHNKDMPKLGWHADDGSEGGHGEGSHKVEGGGTGPKDPIEIDISKYFKTGTFEYSSANAQEEEEAITYLEYALDQMGLIDSEVYEVIIEGSASGDRDHPDNPGLARGRAKIGEKVFIKALMRSDQYTPEQKQAIIDGMKVESNVKWLTAKQKAEMSPTEKKQLMDSQQGVKVIVRAKVQKMPISSLPTKPGKIEYQNGIELKTIPLKNYDTPSDFENVRGVVVDPSQSMINDANDLRETLEEVKVGGQNLVEKTITGGNHEETLKTIFKTVKEVKASGYQDGELLVITDEPDIFSAGEGNSNAELVSKILEEAGEINIVLKFFDPDKEGEGHGGYKVVNLRDNPNALDVPSVDENGNRLIRYYDKVRAWYRQL